MARSDPQFSDSESCSASSSSGSSRGHRRKHRPSKKHHSGRTSPGFRTTVSHMKDNIAILRRHLREEREQYLLKQWEQERDEYLDEISTKDKIIHQLEEELIERPSHRDIAIMRAELQRAKDAAGLAEESANFRMESSLQSHAAKKKGNARGLMEYDKRLHIINKKRSTGGLPALQDLDPVEVIRFASSIMFQLKLVDLGETEKRIEELCKTVRTTIPSLRTFAEEIYALHGDVDIDQHGLVAKVRGWKMDSGEVESWLKFQDDLAALLSERSSPGSLQNPGLDSADVAIKDGKRQKFIHAVKNLVEFENKMLKAKGLLMDVEEEMKENKGSEHVALKIVKHFMQLFDVSDLQGVYPMMNTVFGRLHELSLFWKTLCGEFRLDPSVPPSTVLEKILQRE